MVLDCVPLWIKAVSFIHQFRVPTFTRWFLAQNLKFFENQNTLRFHYIMCVSKYVHCGDSETSQNKFVFVYVMYYANKFRGFCVSRWTILRTFKSKYSLDILFAWLENICTYLCVSDRSFTDTKFHLIHKGQIDFKETIPAEYGRELHSKPHF